LDPIIGTPYGSVFTVADDGKTLQPVLRRAQSSSLPVQLATTDAASKLPRKHGSELCMLRARSDAGEWAAVEATERNNAELLDDGANQALVQADINRMKQAGATGEEARRQIFT
jgi:hypothetical protein